MERSREKQRKKRMTLIVTAAVVIIAVIVTVATLAISGAFRRRVDESFFESDDGKLVVSMNSENASFENSEYEPEITRIVYYHDGTNITGMEIYYEYKTDAEAGVANGKISTNGKDWATSKTLSGRYIIFGVSSDEFAGLTVEQTKETIENMKAAGATIDSASEESVTEVTTTEE